MDSVAKRQGLQAPNPSDITVETPSLFFCCLHATTALSRSVQCAFLYPPDGHGPVRDFHSSPRARVPSIHHCK